MMTKPLYLALAKNLQKTEFIIEILLSVCSTEQTLWKLLQSEDTVALLHKLPVEVLHLLAGKMSRLIRTLSSREFLTTISRRNRS